MAGINSVVISTGRYLPEKRIGNSRFVDRPLKIYLGENPDGSPVWEMKEGKPKYVFYTKEGVLQRTGIKERRYIGSCETMILAVSIALERALKKASIGVQKIDGIICASISQERRFPSLACELQNKIQARNVIIAFDVAAGCAGFGIALNQADMLIKTRQCKMIAVVGVEILSPLIDYTERNCIIFGDGCGVVILGAAETKKRGIISHALSSDSLEGKTRWLFSDRQDRNRVKIRMPNGSDIFKLAIRTMVANARKVILNSSKYFGLDADQGKNWEIEEFILSIISSLDLFIPHQANIRIINAVENRLKSGKVFVNIDKYGNTSSASCPIALDEAWEQGRLKRDSFIMIDSFGAGLVGSASLIIL